MRNCAVVLCLVLILGISVAEENVLQKPEEAPVADEQQNSTDYVKQPWMKCVNKLTYRCVKVALARLAKYLPQAELNIAPGISVLANSSRSIEVVDLVRSVVSAGGWKATSPSVVLPKMRNILDSLSVQVRLEDPALLRKVKTLSEEVVDGLVNTGESEARKKGGGGALLWSAGALAAVGMAALAAVAGKAMMASLMALMLSGLTALRGGGGGGGGGGGHHHAAHVEIIKTPAHLELAPAAHYEAGAHGYEQDHYYTAPGYEYGRKISGPRGNGSPQTSPQVNTNTS